MPVATWSVMALCHLDEVLPDHFRSDQSTKAELVERRACRGCP